LAATIVHFGVDRAARIPVLASAGFEVDICSSIDSLIETLERQHVAAVVLPDKPTVNPEGIVDLIRSESATPLILFAEQPGQPYDKNFDLVIPVLTPPQKWLADIVQLIAHTKAVIANSQSLHAQTSVLRNESRASRQRLEQEIKRARVLKNDFVRSDDSVLPKPE
jgi:hypothetical protein